MALDPSLFFQGAQLQAQNDAQTRATIANVFDKLAATKERQRAEEKALATDYEGSMMRVLTAQAAGQQPDPADLMRAQAFDRFNQAQNAIDPVTGNPYPKNASILGSLEGASAAPYPSQGLYGPPGMQTGGFVPPDAAANMAKMNLPNSPYNNDLGNINDVVPPLGDNYMDVAGITPAQRTETRMGIYTPAPTGNRKLDQSNLEAASKAKIDLEKRKIEKEQDRANLKNEPMNELQGKTATFVDRMTEANKVISDKAITAEQLNLKNRAADKVPLAGNFMVTPNYQKASQAERNFINAVLRRESGAAIAPSEFSNAREQYFPQPGDGPDVIAQKKQNRQTAIAGFQREAGPAYVPKEIGTETTPPKSGAVSYEEYFK